jgi:hypothetical protein
MQVWKSTDGIAAYNKVGDVQDVSATNPRSAWYYNIPSFSHFTLADDNDFLPLGLIRFAGANVKGNAQLNWTITNEKNWNLFVVERSADGKQFGPIGTVNSFRNGRASNNYTFVDKATLVRGTYYRLKLIDEESKFEYSETVFIKAEGEAARAVSIFPNPAAQGAEITINGLTDITETVTVTVVGMDGRTVQTLNGPLTDVNRDLQTGIQALPSGLYQVKVTLADQIKTLKLIKQ